MSLIQWKDSMSVHVAAIDQDHKTLIAMINDLYDAMKQGRGKDEVGRTISGLHSYTLKHFGREEWYFDRFEYPEAESHKTKHAYFVQTISDFQKNFEKGEVCLSIEVMNFLVTWLKTHIMEIDRRYSKFFTDRGLN